MKSDDELRQENKLLRDRISRLSAASLRISKTLDINTVLREVVDSAREMTNARYAMIVTLDDSGQIQDYVGAGISPDVWTEMESWPDGRRLFHHLRMHPGILRVPDIQRYIRTHGFVTDLVPAWPLQGTPLLHRGAQVGNFFLCGKKGAGEFTVDDEEVFVLFALQAATAIANARTHRDEQRARADLEALVDISPVGVLVFDSRTQAAVLSNREAKRIVGGLYTTEHFSAQQMEVMRIQRADGEKISLERFLLAQTKSDAAPVRAEEIVLEAPDGRSVTTLVNCTPIRSGDETESIIVTFQDLAPLQELEHLRAEFLGMVSHELRAPLTSIKGSTATVLGASPSPETAEMLQFFRIIDEQADHMYGLISDLLDTKRIETGTLSVTPEPTEVTSLVDQARNTFLSGGGRNPVRIDLPQKLPRVMADRQRIVQVLNNLLSNASKHSPESSPIRVAAVQIGVYVEVSVSDEGRGVSSELLPHLFRKHVRISGDHGVRGAGLGLAICKGLVEAHGGRIRAESDGTGLGTRFAFTIPVAPTSGTAAKIANSRKSSRTHQKDWEETRILVVDDDPQMLRYVGDVLTKAGYFPLVTGDPREVSRLIKMSAPRLVLLDLILPGIDGINLMDRLPELGDLPVIFISGYGRDETIAKALEIGAVDYIVKPFSPTELTARVHSALRRHNEPAKPFLLGELTIHYNERCVVLDGDPLELTVTEYDLLRVLSAHAGRVVTYKSLLRQIWGRRDRGDVRPVRAFVRKLRHKLRDNASNPTYIFNVRGVGYRMAQPSDT